jgi:hypothetical protein
MMDRANIPTSPACGHWETLLADALDGLLKPEDEATFASHMATCPACTALFEEARKGREWLGFLSTEPEVPAGLLDKILAQTGPGQVAGYGLVPASGDIVPMIPAWQRPGFMGFVRRFAEPRLMMTAAMAFFSIALTLNLTGVRLSNVKFADLRENLRPSAMQSFMERRLTMASAPVIRYYDHLRFVYEVESRMRELRREGESTDNQKSDDSAPAQPGESNQTPGQNPEHKNGGSHVDPPQQSAEPAQMEQVEYLETSLDLQKRPAHSGGSAMAPRERSTEWIA